MAIAYTRQSSFADGDTITAALFNDEYNQLVNAFAYSSSNASTTGHRHDGTAGQGGNIPQIGDLDFLNKIVVDSTNNRWGIFVEVGGSAVEQIRFQDGALLPVTDSDVDLGTSSLYFKDAFIDSITTTGNVAVGGNLTVTGTTTFNGGTITMGDAATDNVVFGADVDSNIIPDDDNTYDLGSSSQEWKDLYVDGIAYLDGINFNGTAITATAAELNILDGVTSTAAELNILDGVTSTATELNLLDGSTANTVVNSKAVIYGSSGELAGTLSTAAQTNITSLGTLTTLTVDDITINGSTISDSASLTIDVAGDIILDADDGDVTFVDGGTTFGKISNSAGNLLINSEVNDKDIQFNGKDGGLNVTALQLDMSQAGRATFSENVIVTGELSAATLDISGDVDVDGTLEADAITVNGTTLAETISDTVGAMVTSNTETGVTVTYDDSDNTLDFVIGTLNQDTTGNAATATALETARTIHGVSFDGTANIDLTEVVQDTVGAMFSSNTETGLAVTYEDSDGTIDVVLAAAQPTVTSLGTLTTLTVDDITINGSTISDAGDLTVDVGGDIILDADDGFINLKDGGTEFGTLFKSSDSFFIKNPIVDGDIKFQVNDGGSGVVAFQIDASDAGTVIFNNKVGIGTTSPATTLEVNNASAGATVATFEGQYSSSGDVKLASFERNGGAVAAAITYADANTNMEFGTTTSHSLSLTTADTTRVTIDSSGNVGIGTTSPSHELTVGDANAETTIGIAGNRSQFGFKSDLAIVQGGSGKGIQFNVNNNTFGSGEAMRINSSGNVGIGTTSPASVLTYSGSFNATSAGSKPSLTGAGSYGGGIGFVDTNVSGMYTDGSGANLRLFTNQSGSDRADAKIGLSIDGSQNVGIGTTSPDATLHVSGTTTITGNTVFNSGNRAAGNSSAMIRANSGFSSASTPDFTFFFNDQVGLFHPSSGTLGFTIDGSEAMRLDSSGNLLVGSTTDHEGKVQIAATNEAGLFVKDSSVSNSAPYLRVQGQRSDGNTGESFTGGLVLESYRTDAAVPNDKALGTIYFGGNHTNGTESNISYAASIVGIAEGAFNSATDMPTGLAFFTGDAGTALKTANTSFGTERMRIDHDGKVGIGTASPASLLHIEAASAPTLRIDDSDSTNALTLAQDGANGSILLGSAGELSIGVTNDSSSDAVSLKTRNSTRLYVAENGRVGVGTTSPDVPFQVEAGQNVLVQLEATHTDGNARMLFKPKDNNGWNIGANDDGSFTIFDVVASTNSVVVETGAAANTLVVDSNSRVGIGTASPTEKLTVAGAITTTGALSDDRTSTGAIDFSSGVTRFVSYGASSTDGIFAFRTAQGGASSTERMRIDGSGNVGIGTTSPASKLTLSDTSSNSVVQTRFINDAQNFALGVHGGLSDSFVLHDETNSATRVVVDSSGNVGIGTTSPSEKLSLEKGISYNADSALFATIGVNDDAVNNNAVYRWRTGITGNATGHSLTFSTIGRTESSYTERMRIDSSGRLMVGTTTNADIATHTPNIVSSLQIGVISGTNKATFGLDRIHFDSSNYYVLNASAVGVKLVNGATAWTTQSDENLKENIVELTGAIDKIKDYRCVEYNLITDETKSKKIGFIAQDWQKDYDQIIDKDDDDNLGIRYTETIPVLLKAIQEQQAQIEALQSEINELKNS